MFRTCHTTLDSDGPLLWWRCVRSRLKHFLLASLSLVWGKVLKTCYFASILNCTVHLHSAAATQFVCRWTHFSALFPRISVAVCIWSVISFYMASAGWSVFSVNSLNLDAGELFFSLIFHHFGLSRLVNWDRIVLISQFKTNWLKIVLNT